MHTQRNCDSTVYKWMNRRDNCVNHTYFCGISIPHFGISMGITLISQLYLNHGRARRERLSLRPNGSVSCCLLASHSFNALGNQQAIRLQGFRNPRKMRRNLSHCNYSPYSDLNLESLNTERGVCPSTVEVCAVP